MPLPQRRPRKPKIDFLKASQNADRFRASQAATRLQTTSGRKE